MPFVGEAVCLLTALLWAFSVTLFRAAIEQHGARTINMAKCTLGAGLQGITVLALGQWAMLGAASSRDLWLLTASGIVGLALGDTALFASVGRIGVHRTLLLQTLAPVFAALLAAAWQGEIPTTRQGLGAVVVLAGVALVVAPGRRGARAETAIPSAAPIGPANGDVAAAIAPGGAGDGAPIIEPAAPRAVTATGWDKGGLAAGVLAAACQGAGVVLAKEALTDVPVVAASFVRLATAALTLLAIGAVTGRIARLPGLVRSPVAWRRVVPATCLGTYLALFSMMAGVALAPAAIAAVLLSTSPVFSLILESVQHRQRPPARGIAGTLLALLGVAVLAAG